MEGHLYPAVLDFRDFLESAEILAIDLKSRPDTQKSRAFIPTEALKDYLSEGRLKRLLRYYNIPATHCEEIQERYLIVFTILFVIGKCAEINCFLHIERLNDDRLPFGKHDGQIWPKECSHFFHEFWNAQWKFCAHRLMRNALHAQRFEEERILPIIGRKIISEGPDSCTSKIEILPSYNFLTPPESDNSPVTNNTFVLKTFRRKDYDLYDNEVRAYKIIYSEDVFSHHTVKFYDSWIQNQEYSILMEYVEGGTLEEFFFSCPPPTDEEDIILFWERFVDLLKPLSRIHMHPDPDHRYKYLEGIHNDIKPTNILVTKPKSRSRYDVTFKLADMGLSHFAPAQKEGESRTKDTRGTQIFTAPEYYRDEKNTFLRRDILKAAPSKDIWSMGCVFSETVVWSVGGKEDLQKYGEDRVSATNQIPKLHNSAHAGCFHDGERVLDVVRETLVRAYRNRRQHDHIVPGMVTITEDMLETSPRRPNAVEVYSRCEKILSHAKTLSGPKSKNYQNETYPAIFQTSPMPPELPPDFDISALGFRYPDEFGSPRTSWDNRPPHRGTNLNGTTLNGAHRRDQHHDRYHTNAQASPPLNSKYPKEFSHHMSYHGSASSSESTLQRRPFSYPLPQPYGDQPSKGIVAPSNYQGSIIQGLPPLQPEFRPSITGMRPQTPESADLRRSEKPYDLPTVSIERVNEWISRRGMPGREKKSTSLLRMIEYLRTLDNRDQIFLFDNSASMQHHWPDVKSTFGALAYLVKSKDPDGIEIRFTSSPTTTARNRNRAPLLSKLNSIGLGGHCDIGLTLGKILRDLGPKGPKSLSSRLGLHKNEKYGVTIYVLTNGIWRDGDDWLDGIVKPIKNLVAQGTEKRQLGIQFIQFGQDPEGTKRLEILDDELRQHGVTEDFVDIEHWTGNVYKMLLGAIDPRWDRMRTQKSHNGTTSATHRRTSNSQYLDELPTFSTGTSSTRYNRSDKVGSSIPMPVLYETQATSFSEPLVSGLSPPTQDPTLFEDQVRQNTDMSSTGYSFSDKVGSSIPMPVIYETQATSFSEPLVSGLSPPTQDPTLFEDQVRQNTDTSSTGYSFSDKVGSSISMPVSYETQATSFSEPPILFEGQARQNTHGFRNHS
ncbi:hypothetical protein DM02DRAFT_34015 [Periconia macrospinosa]|uniref:Protein kinase domain-containing protein n=1 Tax=Periconia macrospinosa TaxID=97972 RepID=A0A2V1E9Q2_9PLEO|nr:hypothetical protein DM02DRAFT_34015 [Periconia macrospinosa]